MQRVLQCIRPVTMSTAKSYELFQVPTKCRCISGVIRRMSLDSRMMMPVTFRVLERVSSDGRNSVPPRKIQQEFRDRKIARKGITH